MADPAVQPHPADPHPDADADCNDSDDDWFNKSLDEFDVIPPSSSDRWSDEDVDEDPDGRKQNDRTRKDSQKSSDTDSVTGQTNRKKQSQNPSQDPAPSKSRLKLLKASNGKGSEETSSGNEDDEDDLDSDCVEVTEAGVAMALVPKISKHFRLLSKITESSSAESEQNGDNDKSKEESQGEREQHEKRKDDNRLTVPAEPGNADKEKKSDRDLDLTDQETGGRIDQERKQYAENVEIEQTENASMEEESSGQSTDKDDKSKQRYMRKKEAREEKDLGEKDEDWFQNKLKELPTLFNQHRVHTLTEARLKSNETMLINVTGCDKQPDALKISDLDTELFAILMVTERGEYDCVEMCKFNKTDGVVTSKSSKLMNRRLAYANFKVVLKWLMGKKEEAENLACHLVTERPFSLVAAANLFYILWRKGERSEAIAYLKPLMMLKQKRPNIYEGIMCEELGEMGLCYTELGPEFIQDALATLEEVVRRRPDWHHFKWDWALNLRRLTNARHTWSQPLKDIITPLLKATDLLLDIIRDAGDDDPDLRTAAAAELGEILNGCQFEKKLQNTVGQRALDAGLDAEKCFDIVMEEEDTGGSNLVRAGKYFRYSGQLHKSEKALKKAVAVQNSPKVHHQLALTLRKLVIEERRRAFQLYRDHGRGKKPQFSQVRPRRGASRQHLGIIPYSRLNAVDSKMADLSRAMKASNYQCFSREDKYVNETMHHLNKALMLSHGENDIVSYDLGLMYKALGEYTDALAQFLMVVEVNLNPANEVNAFEQAALVTLEKCSLEDNETKARQLQEEGRSLLNMALLVQAHTVYKFRMAEDHENHAVWKSFHTLGQYLQLQSEVEGVCQDDSPVEIWVLRLLRVYADTLPVLASLQQLSARDADRPQVMKDRLHKYFRDQRYEDVLLLICLLNLTDNKQMLDSDTSDLCLKAYIMAARTKLLDNVNAGQCGSSFNANMAKKYFCWAFETVHGSGQDKDHTERSSSGSGHVASADPLPSPSVRDKKCMDSKPEREASFRLTRDAPDETESKQGGPEDALDYHVALIYDPRDTDSSRAAQELQSVLQNTCGLRVYLPESGSVDAMEKSTLASMGWAHLLLFVLSNNEMSSSMENYMQHAAKLFPDCMAEIRETGRKPSPSILTLTLADDATAVPKFLRHRPSFAWSVGRQTAGYQARGTVNWVDSVCKLFSFLIRLQLRL